MSKSVTLFTRVDDGSAIPLAGEVTLSAGRLTRVDESFSDGDMTIVTDIDVSKLQLIYILSDVSISADFNGNGEPQFFSVNLTAGVPWEWHTGSGHANPFGSQDVTSIDFSSSPVPVRVQYMILTDPTP